MEDDPCMVVKIQEDGRAPAGGWVVVCCEEHDPLMTTWDTAAHAKAAISKSLGISLDDWWLEDGRWMAETQEAPKLLPPGQRMISALRQMIGRERHGMATVTNRVLPLRLMRQMQAAGLVKSAGMVVVCDGDGFSLQPEREREGWTVTRAGELAAKEPPKEPPNA